ncbi:MAG: ATP-grasp domain-containing protein [Spirochaetaceae bacterium]|jgi:biotin carboxylase|nr:ATP-grasp domain-containing protein [Spirochaetaceae bacterium]
MAEGFMAEGSITGGSVAENPMAEGSITGGSTVGGRKKRILILGAGIMQGPAIRRAGEMGLETVVVDGDPQAPLAGEADRFEAVDLKDIHAIEKLARTLKEEGGLDGVMTAGTDFSASVAWTAEKLGLPGISYETALDASDKERMRRRFEEAGLPSPGFVILTGAVPAALPFPFPAVVKPVDNMGARGCRRVDSPEELGTAAAEALRFSRSGRVIVEEFMEGPEFSLDAVVYRGEVTICGVADRHIFFPPYFIEMGHTMPAAVFPEDRDALTGLFIRGIRALGIDNGAAKGDLKLTSKGPMIGEIAARLSGGYMSGWTYPYASGADPARGAVCAALGLPPGGLEPVRNWTSAERAFISIPGVVRGLYGLDRARGVPGVRDLFLRTAPGRRLFFPENNVSKAGNVISATPDRGTAAAAAESAARAVLIRLKAPDKETEAFLAGSTEPFPPPAFSFDPELLAAVPEMTVLPEKASGGPAEPVTLVPVPALTGSDERDYQGRTVTETLEAVRELTALALPEYTGPFPAEDSSSPGRRILGREFWRALIRGGYQGAVYYIDCLFPQQEGGRGESLV